MAGAFGHEFRLARGCSIFHTLYSCIAGPTYNRLMSLIAAMVESHQHGVFGKEGMKRLRATIGLLRDRLIAPRTLARYRASSAAFVNSCSIAGYPKPHTATEMDLRLL